MRSKLATETVGERPTQQAVILQAAAKLLTEHGPAGISTRAVAAAAGVQTPALYRLFGDKDGLLDALGSYGFESYLAEKRSLEPSEDAIDDIRRGWNIHVEFGLANPAFYALMYGNLRPGRRPAAAQENAQILRRLLERARQQGRLRVPVEDAARAIEASTTGAVLLLLAQPEDERDPASLTGLRDTVINSIISDAAPATDVRTTIAGRALALLAALGDGPGDGFGDGDGAPDPVTGAGFSAAEAAVLREWLGTLTRSSPLAGEESSPPPSDTG
jgi:AcrR family transcriptional regulator